MKENEVQRVSSASRSSRSSRSSAAPKPKITMLSVISIYLSALCMQFEYAILMPTVWQYVQSLGGDKFMLGVAISCFSMARIALFIFIGAWMDVRGFREPYLFSFFCGMLGSFLYGIAGKLNSLLVLILGRLVIGCGAANATLNESYITKVYSPKDRTKQLAIFDGTQIVGLAAGPALNLFFTDVNFQIGFIEFNIMTAPGFFMVFMNLLSFLMVYFFVEEPPSENYRKPSANSTDQLIQKNKNYTIVEEGKEGEDSEEISKAAEDNEEGQLIEPKDDDKSSKDISVSVQPKDVKVTKTKRNFARDFKEVVFQRGGLLVLCVKFTIGFLVTALETAVTPITSGEFHWTSFQNSLAFAALAVVSIFGVIGTILLSKWKFGNRTILALGALGLAISSLIAGLFCFGVHIPFPAFAVTASCIVLSLPLLNASSSGLFSRMIEPHPPGKFFGAAQLLLVVGKILGPLFAGWTLRNFQMHLPFFGTTGVVLLVFTVFPLVALWKTVAPYSPGK